MGKSMRSWVQRQGYQQGVDLEEGCEIALDHLEGAMVAREAAVAVMGSFVAVDAQEYGEALAREHLGDGLCG